MKLTTWALLCGCFTGAIAQNNTAFDLIVRESTLPDNLNPITSSGALAQYVQNNIFAALMEYNPETLKMEPVLATAAPVIAEVAKGKFAGGMSLTYEIRPEAVWDNGTPITANDYLFTVKVVVDPFSHAGGLSTYYEFIDSIQVDKKNPKKFTIYSKEKYFTAAESSGELQILPEYIYDPDKHLRKVPLSALKDVSQHKALENNPNLKAFSDNFSSALYENDPAHIVGAGAYKITEWKEGEQLVLERKTNWWGDKIKGSTLIAAYPNRIIYRVFDDNLESMKAFKDGKIDVYRDMPPSYFLELKEHPRVGKDYTFSSPEQFSYAYIGFDLKNPKLSDKLVRRAIAHLLDRQTIVDDLYSGLAITTNTPIHPNKEYYHKGLVDKQYDPATAKKLLAEAGWTDSNNNGVVDKTIDGQLVEMKLTYKYNKGNVIRKNIGLLLQNEAQLIGIHIELVEKPWNEYIKDIGNRDFELFSLAWVQGPGLDDMKQIWHTSANNPDGSNRIGFGSPESDKIIEEIRHTLDATKRNELYKKIQEIIYEEQPYIFLVAPLGRVAISNKFANPQGNRLSPGYQERYLKLK